MITTFAGTPQSCGYSGDGGPVSNALLNYPAGLFIDSQGSLYIADANNCVIRKVTGGTISTFAGDGGCGFTGDGVPANATSLYNPEGVSGDAAGNVYIADTVNHRIRMVNASTHIIGTVAGDGNNGFSGDGLAAENSLSAPTDVKSDANGNLFIADTGNQRLRWVTPSGLMTSFAGNGNVGYSGDGGPATNGEIAYPTGIFEDSAGNFLVADDLNLRVRRVSAFAGLGASASSVSFGVVNIGATSPPQVLTLSAVGPLTLNAFLVSGGFEEADNCPASLPSGQKCTVYLYFRPTATGTQAGSLTVEHNGYFGTETTIALQGAGSAISITGAPVSFGSQEVKTTSAGHNVTVSNKGPNNVTMGAVTLSDTTNFGITANNCPAAGSILASNASCTISLTFAPQTTGVKKAFMSINDSDAGSPQLVGLSGIGSSTVTFSPASVTFAAQAVGTTSAATKITLTNKTSTSITLGTQALTVSGPFVTTTASTCTNGKVVASNGTCLIYVAFKPSVSGYAIGTLSVTDSDATSPQTVALAGTGTFVEFSPSSLNWGVLAKGYTASAPVTITNVGSQTVTFTAATITGGTLAKDFSDNLGQPPCGGPLAPGAVCTLTVSFTPSIPGSESATLQLYDNSAESPQTLPLSGTGTSNYTVVPGPSNPYLASAPNGTSCCGGDSAPAESPVLVTTSFAPGNSLTFSVSGSVNYGGGPANDPPDGSGTVDSPSNGGIAEYAGPADALVGVFLKGTPPSTTPAALNFTSTGLGTSFKSLSPKLGQVFFIGDGLTGNGTGTAQTFVVPAGATALYLGTSDGFGWSNNTGSFAVTIAVK